MKIRAFLAMLALVAGTVAFAPTPAHAATVCPPHYSGDWDGTYNAIGSGTIHARIDVDAQDHETGPLQLDNGNTGHGTWDGDVEDHCAHVVGTYTDVQLGQFQFVADLNDLGTILSGTFSGPANGDFVLTISADSLSVAVGSATVFEGNTPGGQSFSTASRSARLSASAQARLTSKQTRTATLPVTLATPAPKAVVVMYRFVDGTAVAGVDYVDTGLVHKLTIGKGQTEKDVAVKVISNDTPEPDRSFSLQIVSVSGGFQAFNDKGTATIANDDGSPTP